MQELEDRLDVHLGRVAAGDAEREPVEDDRREPPEVDQVDVVPEGSVLLALSEPRDHAVTVAGVLVHAPHELLVVAKPRLHLHEDPEKLRVLARHRADGVVEPPLDDEVDI